MAAWLLTNSYSGDGLQSVELADDRRNQLALEVDTLKAPISYVVSDVELLAQPTAPALDSIAKGKPAQRFRFERIGLVVAAISLMSTASLSLASDEKASFGWLLFGDLYHIPSHHLAEGDNATGAVVRRVYLTADGESEDGVFGRMRIEINQSGEFETYEFEMDFKDFYIGYDFGEHEFKAGLQPTFTFDFIESVWGMRYLMRTAADLQGVPSRDTGLSIKGPINDTWSYRALSGYGADFGAESGDGDYNMAAINWKLNDHWALDFYVDYERRPGETDQASGQVFAGYLSDTNRFGVQYLYREQESGPPLKLASAFIVNRLSDTYRVVGRVDRVFEPSLKGDNISYIPFDPTAPATLLLAGIEHRFNDNFYVTPNTVVIRYDTNDDGVRPKTDFYLRLTFFFDFE